jgi:predicted amidohydrolase
MTVRLCELPIRGGWEGCMDAALEACGMPPKPRVAVLPELFTIGYRLDLIPGAALEPGALGDLPLADAAGSLGIWIVGGSFPVRGPKGITNCVPVFDPRGRLAHTAEKIHLFRSMGEHRVFTGGYPSGVFDMSGLTAGAAVCYDLRFPEVFRPVALAGAEILFIPAQWPLVRRGVFRNLLAARSAEAQVFTAGCNLGGDHLGVRYRGGGAVAAPSGSFLPGERVAPGIMDFTVEPGMVREERRRIDCLADRRPEVYQTGFGGPA